MNVLWTASSPAHPSPTSIISPCKRSMPRRLSTAPRRETAQRVPTIDNTGNECKTRCISRRRCTRANKSMYRMSTVTDTRENCDVDRGGKETMRQRAGPGSQERSEAIDKARLRTPDRSTLKLCQPVHKFVNSHEGSLYVASRSMTPFFGCFPYEPLYTTVPLPMLACAVRVVL